MNDKTIYKIGEMLIDSKQVFWRAKYCYAHIPIVRLLDGHIIITPKRQVADFALLEPVELFDITLVTKLLARGIENFYSMGSSTIQIQNAPSEGNLKQLLIHVIPRKLNDLKGKDEIYALLETYPEDLIKYYNEKMNFYVNAYANKIIQGIYEEAKKYEAHMALCYKEDKET